jgi:hypothetical protein
MSTTLVLVATKRLTLTFGAAHLGDWIGWAHFSDQFLRVARLAEHLFASH